MRRLHSRQKQPYCVISIYLEEKIFRRSPKRFRNETVIPILNDSGTRDRQRPSDADDRYRGSRGGAAAARAAEISRGRSPSCLHNQRPHRDLSGRGHLSWRFRAYRHGPAAVEPNPQQRGAAFEQSHAQIWTLTVYRENNSWFRRRVLRHRSAARVIRSAFRSLCDCRRGRRLPGRRLAALEGFQDITNRRSRKQAFILLLRQ